MSNVSETTTNRVLNKAKELDYQGNEIARALRNKKTSNIGVIIPSISNPFFLMLVESIEHHAASQGYNIFLCDSRDNPKIEKIKIKEVLKSNVAGILISPCYSMENYLEIKNLAESNKLIQVDRKINAKGLSWVGLDDNDAMKQIVEHLAAKGVRSAAFITSTKGSSSGLLRQKYVLSHAKKNNIQIRPDLILDGDFSVEWGVKAANLICEKKVLPDAVICSDDLIALGVLSQLLKQNKRVPQDILVSGLDNVSFTNLFSPTLTTLAQPLDAIAETALNLLFNHDQIYDSKNQIAHKGRLIVRESTSN